MSLFICFMKLLEKDANKRLGSLEANHSAEDVIRHQFFSSMDWSKLERRELEPPYMPRVVSINKILIKSTFIYLYSCFI